jgi:hypothetical protein
MGNQWLRILLCQAQSEMVIHNATSTNPPSILHIIISIDINLLGVSERPYKIPDCLSLKTCHKHKQLFPKYIMMDGWA